MSLDGKKIKDFVSFIRFGNGILVLISIYVYLYLSSHFVFINIVVIDILIGPD